jgi:hypothetical protein
MTRTSRLRLADHVERAAPAVVPGKMGLSWTLRARFLSNARLFANLSPLFAIFVRGPFFKSLQKMRVALMIRAGMSRFSTRGDERCGVAGDVLKLGLE